MIGSWQHIRVLSSAIFALLLACCGQETPAGGPVAPGRAMRIVSIDYCADQFVLKLVDKERILAVSQDAERPFSYMRSAAKGVRKVRSTAEDVLALRPDLVVRAYGGGPNAAAFFKTAGVPVLTVGWANDIDQVKDVIASAAAGLDETARGEAVIADMDLRLASIRQDQSGSTALYMTPSGVTSGPGSLVDDIIGAAGLANYQNPPGWRSIPLEAIAQRPPDMVAAAFFDSENNHKSGWSAMRHPVAQTQLAERPTVYLDGAWTSCGGWYLLDAVEALAQSRPAP